MSQGWSGPVNSGWDEGQQPPQQPPQQGYQQPPQQYQEPGGAQAWQQQSQTRYGPQGGDIFSTLDPKTLNMGILVGGALIWMGHLVLMFADSRNLVRIGVIFTDLGSLAIFGAAVLAGTMVPSTDKMTKLGYMGLAGFGLFSLSLGVGMALGFVGI